MARKYSSEYKNLQPYVIEDVRKVVNAVGAAGGTGGGSMEVHALNGAYHSGELAQSQASWAATKVELSNHAALPDVHHARAHSITSSSDHTVTGSQYQIVGLTSTNTLGLLTAASSPTANQVVKTDGSSAVTLVDLTVSSDLFMTGTLDFGANTMYEDASYLQVTGSKAVRFGQNIGNANWTIYNAGGYTTTGSISITGSAGDLTVGSNVLFVDNSQANVGINMAPDSQFALDINGPARATYWIGPHAIQLKNVLLLSHYDGRQPFETNFSGEPNGHMGQIATVAGSIVYRPGKFGKAVQTGTTTLNRVTNPSFETGTTGWTYSDSNSSGSMARTAYNAYVGTYSLQLYNNNGGEDDFAYCNIAGLSASTAYTVSAYAYVTDEFVSGATSNRGLYALDTNSAGTAQVSTITGSTGGTWVRHTVTVTMSGSPGNLQVRLYAPRGRVYWDAVQVEQAGGATGYADGDMPGHTWTGTAHASTSNRTTTAYLTYPTAGNINTLRGTIMAWVYPYAAYGAVYLWRATGTTTGNIILRTNGANLEAFWGTSQITGTGALTGNTWQHVAITYDSTTLRLYVNGAEVASGASSGFSGVPANVFVGISDGTNGPFAGLIDDLCILGYASPANEIKSIYESNAPVFAETSTFSFRPTPKGLLWADDEGLWMKDTAANPVFGIYGGESTKSWGGFTMAPGDLLIGNNAVGSSAIFWDQSAGTFGFYGAGSATAQAAVATDGSITAGAGALALNSSGIQITAPSSQTSIGSYKFLVTGKTITSGMYAYFNSGADTYYHGLFSDSSDIGNITTVIGSNLGGGGTAKVQFVVGNSLAVTSTSYTLTSSTSTWWFGDGSLVYVGIGTAAAPTRPFQVVGGLFAGGEETGLAGYIQFTNWSDTSVSTGVGTIKMNSTTARDSAAWIRIYIGTTAYYLPAWLNIN